MSTPSSFSSPFHRPSTNSVLSLGEEITKKIKTFSNDIKRLKEKITYLKNILLYSPEEQFSQEIIKAFEDTVEPAIEELAQYLWQQEEIKKDALLLEAELVDLMIKVIKSIIKFQELLDSLYPGASKKLIDYIDHILIALLATHMPIVALIVKASRDVVFEPFINRIKATLTPESFTKIKERWQEKAAQLAAEVTEMQQHKNFQQKYQTAAQIPLQQCCKQFNIYPNYLTFSFTTSI